MLSWTPRNIQEMHKHQEIKSIWIGAISLLNGKPLQLVDQFIYLNSNISSTESNVNICFEKHELLLTGYQ